jgi:hypothetical protein
VAAGFLFDDLDVLVIATNNGSLYLLNKTVGLSRSPRRILPPDATANQAPEGEQGVQDSADSRGCLRGAGHG